MAAELAGDGSPHRTLADQLRSWSTERLTRLLHDRPDLATPAPHDSGQLASRAATRASVLRALDLVSRWQHAVLHSLSITAANAGWSVRDLLGPEHDDDIDAALERLVDLALVWHAPEGPRPLTTVADALSGAPASALLPVATIAADAPGPDVVAERIAALSGPARALLDHVQAHGGRGTTKEDLRRLDPDAPRTPVEELVARGLLATRGTGELQVPGEVGAVLFTPEPGRWTRPEIAASERSAEIVDRAGAGAAFELVRRVDLLGELWGTSAPGVLRSGGLSVRDLRGLAGALQVPEPEAVLVVEVANAAGLLGQTPDTRAGADAGELVWAPSDAFDAWSTRDVAERWWQLATAWLGSTRAAALVGRRPREGAKAVNALEPEVSHPLAEESRRTALEEWATLAPGEVLATGTGTASLVERLRWRLPRRPALRDRLAAATVDEAAVIGVAALGAMTTAGRALVEGAQEAALAALAPLLPAPVDHVVMQADLTAVAPGPLETELARRLQLVADLESAGGAGVYRFSAGSVRRAFDVGWSAAEVHAFVEEISRTPVPQPLTYLIEDVARTFGTLRVGFAEAFVRSDDETALSALVHDPRAAGLGLRRIAPTVVISSTPLDLLLPRLRELGTAPVVEAADGTVRVARPDLLRARVSRARRGGADGGASASGPRAAARSAAHVAAAVTAVQAGDRTDGAGRAGATGGRQGAAGDTGSGGTRAGARTASPADALRQLREAVETRATVRISYVDNHGTYGERVVDPLRVEGGQLIAYDHRSDDDRSFAVHRISAVAPL